MGWSGRPVIWMPLLASTPIMVTWAMEMLRRMLGLWTLGPRLREPVVM